jgi:hypothetical protein
LTKRLEELEQTIQGLKKQQEEAQALAKVCFIVALLELLFPFSLFSPSLFHDDPFLLTF